MNGSGVFLRASDYGVRTVNVSVPCTAETRSIIQKLREEIDRLEKEVQTIEDNAVRESILSYNHSLRYGDVVFNTWNDALYVYVGDDIQRVPNKSYEVR